MSRKGLNNNNIITAAIEMVEEKGYRNYSLRELAGKLNVQPSSLYNHISGIEEINTAVAMYGIQLLQEALENAAKKEDMKEALQQMAIEYRNFAHKNPELYQTIIDLQMSDNQVLKSELHKIIEPFRKVLERELTDKYTIIHLQRFFRSSLHGYVTLEREGYLKHYEVTSEESFQFMILSFIDLIDSTKEKQRRSKENE